MSCRGWASGLNGDETNAWLCLVRGTVLTGGDAWRRQRTEEGVEREGTNFGITRGFYMT